MSTKKSIVCIFGLVMVVLALATVWQMNLTDLSKESVNIEFVLGSDVLDEYQLFYSSSDTLDETSFDINYSYTASLTKNDDDWFCFAIPADTRFVRFDSGDETDEYYLKSVKVSSDDESVEADLAEIIAGYNDIAGLNYDASKMTVATDGRDPYIVISLEQFDLSKLVNAKYGARNLCIKMLLTLIVLLPVVLVIRYFNLMIEVGRDIYSSKKMIADLSKNDFKNKFSGSYLGVFWAFVQPVVIVTIYWFVFSVGFKSAPIGDCPYLLYLVSGICPWFFFNDALNAATNSLFDYSYIVKKVVFKVDILPIIKIISCAFVHMFFILLVVVVFCLYGEYPTFYALQALYYTFCTFMLSLGITYLTSALAVFFKDLAQIVNILLQFGMWMVPIMYSETVFGSGVQKIFKINPLYYVINGYREAFITHVGFWEHGLLTVYFWVVTLVVFVLGIVVFKKLRPHFADVL